MNRRSFLLGPFGYCTHRAFSATVPAHRGFEDVAEKSGVDFRHSAGKTSQRYLPESMGAGVAMLDYNKDGLLDLFFVNGAALRDPMPPGHRPDKSDPRFWNRLFRNNGDGSFTDVTLAAGLRGEGYGMGVAVGDYNNDGLPDLYVTSVGGNRLYRNNGNGTFSDVTERAGVAGGGWSTGACFVDYDRDGHLDLIVTRYLDWDFSRNIYCGAQRPGYRSYCHPDQFKPTTHLVYHNNGDGKFTDVSKKCGLGAVPSKGLGVAINDFDGDGWPDIAIANDSFPQQLFRNNRDGTFTEVAAELGLAYDEDGKTFAGMGIDFGDYDNDGKPDVFINALARQRYALFQNRQGRTFDYVSGQTGIARASENHSGWGAKFIDYDNDGWKDLFVAQGHVMDNIELTQPSVRYREPLMLMRNRQGKFEDGSREGGKAFEVPLAARGAAFGDLNNDGFVDVVINCNDGPAVVLMNRGGNGNHWLLIDTIGKRSNRDGIGARVRVVSGSGFEQFGFVSAAGSYLSAGDKRLHFGLGQEDKVRLIEVTWPSRIVQRVENPGIDRVLTIQEPG
ncbi:MAG: CRTAC1 family protein [Acidobacteriota bacterium]|nr:CRTAC1 family protein [Acidobacteriota bacterium]